MNRTKRSLSSRPNGARPPAEALEYSLPTGVNWRFRVPDGETIAFEEVNTERSYYEEQVLSPDEKHTGTDILIADKAPPSTRDGI